jgi:RNA polymerase sigma-70 factor (ECF subfamily)
VPTYLDETKGDYDDAGNSRNATDELLLLPMLQRFLLLLWLGLRMPARQGATEARRLLLTMSDHQAAPDTESIWRMLSHRLRQFIRSGVASDSDVDDILQNVFLRIHRNLSSLRDSDRLESWVFQIARHAITDYHRRKPLDPLDAEAVSAPTDDQSWDNLNAEVAGCLGMMIARLPEPLQRAVSMYEQGGLSQNEIASREAITISGAKSRVQRGRSMLKEMLLQCCRLQLDRYGNVVSWNAPPSCDSDRESCKC